MIYTSYYANIKNIPKEYKLVSISRSMPNGVDAIRDYTVDKYPNQLGADEPIVSTDEYENFTHRFTTIEHEKSSKFSKILLAPTSSIFKMYQETRDKKAYKERYIKEVLDKLDLEAIHEYYGDNTVYLCYDHPNDLCHRHYVRQRFNEIGIPCEEFPYKDSDGITMFKENYFFLSMMCPCDMFYEDIKFSCAESLYHALKSGNHDDLIKYSKLDGYKAKEESHTITCRYNWNAIKVEVMYVINKSKFELPLFKEALLDTGTRELIHENTHGDTFWGTCNGVGENMLGKILMKIREELR